jgi:hypothetical protein
MEKGKKRRNSQLAGPGGRGISARRAWAGGPAGPWRSDAARADAVGVGPRVSERRGGGGGANRSARPPVRSAAVLRRESGFATKEWWRGTGGGRGSWG